MEVESFGPAASPLSNPDVRLLKQSRPSTSHGARELLLSVGGGQDACMDGCVEKSTCFPFSPDRADRPAFRLPLQRRRATGAQLQRAPERHGFDDILER